MKTKPVTLTRVMRAIERDDTTGFCKTCGHSQHGVEPDAKNYKCNACGALEVFGAEELLIELR